MWHSPWHSPCHCNTHTAGAENGETGAEDVGVLTPQDLSLRAPGEGTSLDPQHPSHPGALCRWGASWGRSEATLEEPSWEAPRVPRGPGARSGPRLCDGEAVSILGGPSLETDCSSQTSQQ